VLEEGADVARSSRYDAARQFVLSGDGFPNNLVMRTVGVPHPSVRAYRDPSSAGTASLFDIFGLVFIVNPQSLPVLEMNAALADHRFVAHSSLPRTAA
jgi:hypothetical protein